jgi:HEAT repeat protein
VDLLAGRQADPQLIVALGGPAASWVVSGGSGGPSYWTRVWAARGLLWAWDDAALPSILQAMDDEAWRVREMALKVVTRHRLGDALEIAAALMDDPVQRVRTAARRALTMLTAESA